MADFEEREPGDPDLDALVAAAFAELVARYGSEGRSIPHDAARYVVALVAGEAVGCGAVQDGDGTTGEVKRMYVVPGHRGRGIARALLAELEELGRRMGYARLRLTTGWRQPEAIALYESAGYTRTAPYGKYVNEAAATRSYAKDL